MFCAFIFAMYIGWVNCWNYGYIRLLANLLLLFSLRHFLIVCYTYIRW